MSVALAKEARTQAIASIERYFRENFDELRLGNLQAAALLNYFLDEIGPSIYNQAVAEAQERLRLRVDEIDIECHADEFGYWRKLDAAMQRRPR